MIKWREKDIKKLTNSVRKFNASITRMEKTLPELADTNILPSRMNVQDLKEHIFSRKDFNATINRVERWFKKGARDIVDMDGSIKTTRWAKKEAQYTERSIKARKQRLAKKLGLTEKGLEEEGLGEVSISKKIEEIKKRVQEKIRFNFTDMSNEQQSWKNFLKKIWYQSSDDYYNKMNALFRENYYKALRKNLTKMQADIIIKTIDRLRLTDEQLFYMVSNNDDIDIDYIYGPEERDNKYELINETLPIYYSELKSQGLFL